MIYKIHYPFAVLLFLHLSSCSNRDNVQSETIELNINKNKKVKISSLVKGVKYIQLEQTGESIIGGIARVVFANDKIYVLDGHHTKSLFVFTSDGDYLYKIDKQGNGPGEYGYPIHFDLDRDLNIFISDARGRKIIKYDKIGNFIEEYRINVPPDNFIIIDSDHFGIGLSNLAKEETKDKNAFHNFIIISKSGIIQKKLFPIKSFLEHHAMSSSRYMSVFEKELYFHPPLTSEIYTYNFQDEKTRKIYEIDFGVDMPEAAFYRKNFNSIGKAYKKEGYPRYLGFSQNSNFLNISFNANGWDYEFFINKQTSEIIGTSKNKFIDDILCGGLNVKGVVDDDFFGWFESYELKEIVERDKSAYSKNKTLIEFVENIDENDNPLIIKYSFK